MEIVIKKDCKPEPISWNDACCAKNVGKLYRMGDYPYYYSICYDKKGGLGAVIFQEGESSLTYIAKKDMYTPEMETFILVNSCPKVTIG